MQPARGWRGGQLGEGPMIYMVEMDFPHPERLQEWHDWYLAHIRVLLTVPGFRASQRFEAVVGTHLRYLARWNRPRCSTARPIAHAAARPRPANGGNYRPIGTATCSTGSTRHPRCRSTRT